jgi:hypothetical protein
VNAPAPTSQNAAPTPAADAPPFAVGDRVTASTAATDYGVCVITDVTPRRGIADRVLPGQWTFRLVTETGLVVRISDVAQLKAVAS